MSSPSVHREMTTLDVIRLFVLMTLLIFPVAAGAQALPPIAEQMAKAYGLDSFGQIQTIRYTWNVELPGAQLSHRWEWSPKSDTVSYEGKDKEGKPVKVTYQRSQLSSQSDVIRNEIDPDFINDQYWLILPLRVAWDGPTVTDEGVQKLPLGDASAERIVVKYPSEGGYEHGDTWDLYVGANKRIEEIVYHRGGNKPPKVVIATWADYKRAGPLLISTDHRGTFNGQPLRVRFSNVSVKMTGSENWIDAQ